MAAPVWNAFGYANAGAAAVSVVAPTGVDLSTQVGLLIVAGVVSAPTSLTVPNGTPLTGIVVTGNSWYRVFRVTGFASGATITATGDGSAKFMTAQLVGYSGSGIGAVSAGGAKSGTVNNYTIPSLTMQNPGSTVVATFTARDAGTGALVSVSAGTLRGTTRGTGTNNTVVGVSDKATGAAVTGTFSATSGNGGGVQVEILPLATTTPVDQYITYVVENGTKIPVKLWTFAADGVTRVPVKLKS